jgi:hypothetical protein
MRLTNECLAAFSWNDLQLNDDFSMPFFYDRLMKKSSYVVVVLAIVAPFSLAPARVNPAVDSGRTLEANLPVPGMLRRRFAAPVSTVIRARQSGRGTAAFHGQRAHHAGCGQ